MYTCGPTFQITVSNLKKNRDNYETFFDYCQILKEGGGRLGNRDREEVSERAGV